MVLVALGVVPNTPLNTLPFCGFECFYLVKRPWACRMADMEAVFVKELFGLCECTQYGGRWRLFAWWWWWQKPHGFTRLTFCGVQRNLLYTVCVLAVQGSVCFLFFRLRPRREQRPLLLYTWRPGGGRSHVYLYIWRPHRGQRHLPFSCGVFVVGKVTFEVKYACPSHYRHSVGFCTLVWNTADMSQDFVLRVFNFNVVLHSSASCDPIPYGVRKVLVFRVRDVGISVLVFGT